MNKKGSKLIIYNAPELAKTLKVSKQAVYQAHAAGILKSSLETPTGRLLFADQDILDFLSSRNLKGKN